jgi:hypothetical protein
MENIKMDLREKVCDGKSRTIAQAVSRWLPIASARVRARVCSCGICGGQSGAGAGFLRVLLFPLPTIIPTIALQSPSSIIWGWYNRPNNGRSTKWTYTTKNNTGKFVPVRHEGVWVEWMYRSTFS